MPGELVDLRALTLDETIELVVDLGMPRFRGEQVWRWVHAHGVTSFDQMSNVAKDARAQLAERTTIGTLSIAEVQTSRDGTRKMRLTTSDARSIESVLIP